MSPVPIVTAAVAWWHWRSLERAREILPFVLTMVLFLLSFLARDQPVAERNPAGHFDLGGGRAAPRPRRSRWSGR
jgi:hypothetical protein